MNRSRKLTFLAGGVAIIAIGAVVSYFVIQQGDGSAEAKDVVDGPANTAVPVEIVDAIKGPVTKTLSSSSTIEAEQSAEVLAKVSGIVTEVAVREGAAVEKDQVLARVDDEEKKLALEKADLTLRKAEAELNRSKLSLDEELISRFDYEKAVFDRDLARTEKQIKELEYRYAVIRAPFAGRVTATEIVVGQTIQPGNHLITLADFRTLVVHLFLPEKDVFQLEPGQPVGLLPEALAGASTSEDVSFRGRVRDISPVVDPKTGTVKVTVEVLDRSADVRPGAFVRAEIETDRRVDAILVPKLAVVTEGGENFVFVVNEGRAEKRSIELGYTRGAAVEILAGISLGEKIAIAGHTTLEDGESVEVLAK